MLFVLGGLSAFAPLSTDMYLPGLPQLTRALGASSSAAQLTLSACMVGLAIGQLLTGPISDAHGRRLPLLSGLALYVAASVGCAAAPTLPLLLAARFVQGLAGAAGISIARAIVRDNSAGAEAARAYALLMAITGLGPILAPVAGGLLLHVTDWRGVFVALGGIGAALLIAAVVSVPDTLPAELRHRGGLRATRAAIGVLRRDRLYVGHVLAGTLSTATLMAFISASPFVLERIHRLSPQAFSLAFAANGCGILIARQIGAAAVRTRPPARVMGAGLVVQVAGATGALLAVVLGAGVVPLLVGSFLAVGSVGATMPMATALAMEDHPERAGTASGLLGFTQFTLASLAAPVVGVGGPLTAVPMGIAMVGAAAAALLSLALVNRHMRRSAPSLSAA
jgi:MFS transporter, DHA1 family, multidrug resistance protein